MGSRGSVASPTVNSSRVQSEVSSGSRGSQVVTYNDRNSGRTVLREEYSRNQSTMTRTFYDRQGREQREYNYERRRYNNVYVYVYQPVYVYAGNYGWYDPFCSWHHYHNYWSYNWYWNNDPWYGYYGYYYRPYPRYRYPSEWLVDYYWSSLLADEYQAQQDNSTISSQNSTILAQQSEIQAQQAEIDLLKNQMKKQIDDEMVARKSGNTVPMETKVHDATRVYAVTTSMTLVTADAAAITCSLSSGDIVGLAQEGVSESGTTATMLVRSAKAGSCKAGTKILVSIEQLTEFENEFNRRLDEGTEKMKTDSVASAVLQSSDDANDSEDEVSTSNDGTDS